MDRRATRHLIFIDACYEKPGVRVATLISGLTTYGLKDRAACADIAQGFLASVIYHGSHQIQAAETA
jgi:hypothetical protein